MRRAKPRSRSSGGTLAEFGPALWLFFLFIVFPFIDLISFGMGVASAMLIANMSARQAASASTFTEARQSVDATLAQLANWQRFSKMTPQAGSPTGADLMVMVTPVKGGPTQMFAYPGGGSIPNSPPDDPNNPTAPQVNTANSVYQYVVTSKWDVSPMLNFNGNPWLGNIPALGAPVPVQYSATASVEHPDGLNNGPLFRGP